MRFRSVLYFVAGGVALWLLLPRVDGADPVVPEAPRPVSAVEVSPQAATAAEEPVPKGDPPEDTHLVGVLAAPETVELVAKEAGRVVQMRVAAGDRVQRGELLAEISPDDLDIRRQAQAARVRESHVAMEKSRLELDLRRRRVQRRRLHPDLFSLEDRELAESELERASMELEAAQARHAEAEALLELLVQRIARSRIVAPWDGLVSERRVDGGATVAAGQPILELVDATARIVRFAVPADEHRRYLVGTPVQVAADLTAPICAAIERVAPKVENSAPLVFVDARVAANGLADAPLGTAVRVYPAKAGECSERAEEAPNGRVRK